MRIVPSLAPNLPPAWVTFMPSTPSMPRLPFSPCEGQRPKGQTKIRQHPPMRQNTWPHRHTHLVALGSPGALQRQEEG